LSLSVVLAVRPDSRHLARCLAQINFADEIIVLLDRCPEQRALAEAVATQIIEGEWERLGRLRNDGINASKGPWIFELDPEDQVSAELAAEIVALARGSPFDLHEVNVNVRLGAQSLRFGCGDWLTKPNRWLLFRKGAKMWGTEHARPKLLLKGRRGQPLEGVLDTQIGESLSDLLTRLDRCSEDDAKDLASTFAPLSMVAVLAQSFRSFFRSFLREGGILIGGLGCYLAVLRGLYPLLAYLKARQFKAIGTQFPPIAPPLP
jgi:hypothetical protein